MTAMSAVITAATIFWYKGDVSTMTQGSIAPTDTLAARIADLKEQRITAIQAQLPTEG